MPSIYEIDFALGVVRVNRRALDRMAAVLGEELQRERETLAKWLDEKIAFPEQHVRNYFSRPPLKFSFYCLAIVHCYSIVENNRRKICERIPGISQTVAGRLHQVTMVTRCLSDIGIDHERVRCYRTMQEFRAVNNAIKHHRENLSDHIKVPAGRIYKAEELTKLYHQRARHLDTYLADLYKKVFKQPLPVPFVTPIGNTMANP